MSYFNFHVTALNETRMSNDKMLLFFTTKNIWESVFRSRDSSGGGDSFYIYGVRFRAWRESVKHGVIRSPPVNPKCASMNIA